MLLFEIFLALWWIWLPLLVVLLIVRNDKKNGRQYSGRNQAQDLEWNNYIASFLPFVKSRAEKTLINAILERKTPEQLYAKDESTPVPETQATSSQEPTIHTSQQPTIAQIAKSPNVSAPASQPLDGTVLLLYFGAFLLIASAGLFVAMDDFDGLLRTLALAITAGLLYMAGVWIYQTKPKLKQAGISFMGVGLMIAPLIGVAWYNLIAEQTSGAIIWMVTSIACLGLYIHAYRLVNNQFIAYLLIGSFVSSVESSVLVVDMPTYVFAWVAIIVGIGLQVFNVWRGQSKPFLSASDTSSQLLVPLSIISSIILLPSFGNLQLAITLIISGVYYSLLAWQRPANRTNYGTASQLSLLAGISNIAYSIESSTDHVAAVLAVITVVYTLLILAAKREIIDTYGCLIVATVASAGSILFALDTPWPLVMYMVAAIILSATVWLRRQSSEGLMVGGLLLLAMPLVVGQYAFDPHVKGTEQLIYYAPVMIILCAVTILSQKKISLHASFDTASSLYLIGATACLAIGWLTNITALTAVCVLLALSFGILWYAGRQPDWLILSSLVIVIPIAYALVNYGSDDKIFSAAVGLGLGVNVALSLLTRLSAIRWVLVGVILLAPLALGGGGLGFKWEEAGFASGYLIAMASCILARAIARGKILTSSKVAVSSYERGASQAFVAGYLMAGVISVVISLYDAKSQLVTTLILGIISIAVIVVVRFVESYSDALALIPLLLQAMLFSGLRPDLADKTEFGVYALMSTSLGVVSYFLISLLQNLPEQTRSSLLLTATLTSYVGPSLFILQPNDSELFPIALLGAGVLTYYHNRRAAQNNKELSLYVVIAALHWLMYVLGVNNIHVHTHILALELAGFAYWRFSIKDQTNGNNYVVAAYLVTTVPIILQALGDASGETYGLILIAQQAAFMVLGSLFNLRFLIQAGLWVALASVLYQLRGLGWAFLGIIAIALIGIAIYRLQKHDD